MCAVRVDKDCVAAIDTVLSPSLVTEDCGETVCCLLAYKQAHNLLEVIDLFGDNSLASAVESLSPAGLHYIFCSVQDSLNTGEFFHTVFLRI